ncbi:MAG: RNA polymerase factor sigma-54 [Candidatus Edwardsbacteria bacterium]|nr:RNA polymerase factor sigma-54 [Candidatus Edwardsbacteria bacterium]
MNARPSLRQELRQVLAPEMLQLLKLLQLPTLELQQLVRQELEANPLLDEVGEEEPAADAADYSDAEHEADPGDKDSIMDTDKIDWENYLQEGLDDGYRAPREQQAEDQLEPVCVSAESLQDYLLSQLRIACADPADLAVGEYIVGNLDGDGYLGMATGEIAQALGLAEDHVARMLQLVQTFDPPGVGARDIRECLLIQLSQRGLERTVVWDVVAHHLRDLEHQRYQAIARAIRASKDDVVRAREVIATLSPKPGAAFNTDDVKYIYPDLFVERQDGEYVVYNNDQNVPRVRVTPGYRQILLSARKSSPQDREYVIKKLESARFIVRMIEQRRRTVLRIMRSIVDRQREFLDRGIRSMKPMTMRHIADDIGMHESTVSRAVQNKYVWTPHGLLSLRFFFGGGLRSERGEDSVKGIKDTIVEMVRGENAKKPLTDQQIVEALGRSGTHIARRTVAKYRQEERILPVKLRRKR